MHFTRRQLFALTGGSLLAALFTWWPRRKPPATLTPASREADLRAWVDTLLPAEPDFLGALALGVAERIAAAIERGPAYARLYHEALTWLDARAAEAGSATFAGLPEPRRHAIVAAAAASATGSAPRTFFQASLDDALFHAYADPRAWAGIGYAGPPQPIGFLDYAAAPKTA